MGPLDLDRTLFELRITQMETRDEIVSCLKEVHRGKLWKQKGFRSLTDYCERQLGYGKDEVRELLMAMGLIVQTKDLVSSDPATQERIDALKTWRKKKSSTHAIAAYRIFTNRTLLHLARANPKTLEDLAGISGIGPRKIADFGEELLRILPWYDNRSEAALA